MRSVKRRFDLRKMRVRSRIRKYSDRLRLCVVKTSRNLHAQIIDDTKGMTLVAASTLEKDLYKKNASNCNKIAAKIIGKHIADRASKAGIKEVVFDKGGRKYHGVIKVLSDAARTKLNF